jgi:hypothetical protein
MHVMAVSTISDESRFWGALKNAHGRLPKESKWILAVTSTDGSKAVNIITHESIDDVRAIFAHQADRFATTEYFEADAANAVGLASSGK